MAAALATAGLELAVYDIASERVAEIAEATGGRGAASPREAAEDAEALVLMVVTGDQAKEALFGAHGAAEALAEGSAVMLMSTVGSAAVSELDGLLGERGLELLDAPVSGGVRRAESADLLILAGGPRALFERCSPALDAMGSTVVHCGESAGDGQAVKLVNQLLCGVHIAAAAEALAYAEKLGIDPRAAWEAVRHGAAGSFMLEDRGQRMLDEEWLPPRSALDIFVKDMGLVVDAGALAGARTPLAQTAQGLYEEGSRAGLGSEDDSGVIRLLSGGGGA